MEVDMLEIIWLTFKLLTVVKISVIKLPGYH